LLRKTRRLNPLLARSSDFASQNKEDKMNKRLYKSEDNRVLAGVCGGIGEYFNIDPTLIRLAWIIFCALGGSGVLAYIIAAIIVPERRSNY
jgi:phage shock protein C